MKKNSSQKLLLLFIILLFTFAFVVTENKKNIVYASYFSVDRNFYEGYEIYDKDLSMPGIMRDVSFYLTSVLTPNNKVVDVYEVFGDISNEEINNKDLQHEIDYPLATRLASATERYNCHSYAWYSQDITTNNYWMPSPEQYYDEYDMSYTEIDSSDVPRAGDIICYFDNRGTIGDESDDKNMHSGIVLSYDTSIPINNVCGNSNQVLVVSKWGDAGLYQHMGDYCPYTSSHGGSADYVKYYRPRKNAAYTLSQSNPIFDESCTTVGDSYYTTDKYEMYELNINYSSNYQMIISSTYPVNVRLYDVHMQLLIDNPSNTYCNGTYSVTINPYLINTNVYYLRVSYQNANISGTIITHMHDYTYTWMNYMRHNVTCACGDSYSEMHVANGTPISPGSPFSECVLCGGLVLVTINSPGNTNQNPLLNIDAFKTIPYIYKELDIKRKKHIN